MGKTAQENKGVIETQKYEQIMKNDRYQHQLRYISGKMLQFDASLFFCEWRLLTKKQARTKLPPKHKNYFAHAKL